MEHGFKAGFGGATIRFPEEIFPLEGFLGVHDAPHVRIFYLESGGEALALASFEIVMLFDELMGACRKEIAETLHLPLEQVWLHVTHAITTPHAPGGPGKGPGGAGREKTKAELMREKAQTGMYEAAILAAAKEAAQTAGEKTEKAVLSIGEGVSSVNCNRDVETPWGYWVNLNPEAPSNKTLTVVKAEKEDGTLLGLFYSYGIKPCAIDNSEKDQNTRLVSSDVTGNACRRLEDLYGVPVLFFMSAAADQVPREMALLEEVEDGSVVKKDAGVQAGLQIVERLGEELSGDIETVLKGSFAALDPAPLIRREGSLTYAAKDRMEMKPRKDYTFVSNGTEATQPILTATIGPLALVGVKPEITCVTEKELLSKSPVKHTLLISMVNGGFKYMPDRTAYERVTWEAQSSALMPGAAEAFVETAAGLLSRG